MGKGDKKTKRGKITIGSHGVRRPRKIKKYIPASSGPTRDEDEKAAAAAVPATKKSAKKADETVEAAVEKPKAARTKKKAAEPEVTADAGPEPTA